MIVFCCTQTTCIAADTQATDADISIQTHTKNATVEPCFLGMVQPYGYGNYGKTVWSTGGG